MNEWLKANKLTLNLEKTNYIIFHRHKKFTYPVPPIILNSTIINEVKHTKFLGVTIQQQLHWHKHIQHVKNKIAKQCGILYLTRDFLNTKSLINIYYSLIYSNLLYCHTIWGAASKEALHPLTVMQKRVIRTIARLRKREHTNDTFHHYRLLKLEDINKLTSAVFVYKCLHGLIDNDNYFTRNDNAAYNMRNNHLLKLPRMPSSQSHTNIRYHGVNIFNSIPTDIQNKATLSSFKSNLKKHLINQYENVQT